MTTNFPIPGKDTTPNTQEEWFDLLIYQVTKAVYFPLEQLKSEDVSVVSEEIRNWITSLIKRVSKHADPVSQESFKKAYAQTIVALDYIAKIRSQKLNVLKLAMHSASGKIYVWAEINDDDVKTEYELIGIEEKINATFLEKANLILEAIIVEKGDSLAIPGHYKQVL